MTKMKNESRQSEEERARAAVSRLFGVDVSRIAADDAIANLLHASMLPLDDVGLLEQNIRVGNSLISNEEVMRGNFGELNDSKPAIPWNELGLDPDDDGKFDIILANPPFKPTEQVQHGPEREYYESQYSVARGRWDQSFLFLELALKLIKEDGVIGLVMPASVLKSEAGRTVRRLIEDRDALFQVVDFTDKLVFSGVSTHTALVFLKPNWRGSVKHTEIRELLESETGRGWFFNHLLNGHELSELPVSISEAGKPQSLGAPWVFASARELELKQRIELKGTTYSTEFTVDQGVKTGLNEAFIVEEVARESSGYVAVNTPFGIRTIESTYLRTAVLGEDISRYSLSPGTRRLIYPYQADGSVVPEDVLEEESHNLWLYLNEWKTQLSNRRSLKRVSGPWYSFIWPRGSWLNQPKILGPDYAQQSSFAFDSTGEIVPVGGNALVAAGMDFRIVLAILNRSLMNWHITKSSVRKRGAYFAFYGRFIENLPLVNVSMLPDSSTLENLIVNRVDQILELHVQLNKEGVEGLLSSQLASAVAGVNREIDELVLQLYETYEFTDVI